MQVEKLKKIKFFPQLNYYVKLLLQKHKRYL